MAEQKTKPTTVKVQDFLNSVEPEKRREDGIALDRIFQEVTGENAAMWGPSIIGYGSFNYVSAKGTKGVWPRASFSPRKTSLTLYGLKDYPEGAALLPGLGKFTESKGCVYVKKLEDIDLDVLKQLIKISYEYSI
ncbi:MAG: DUF1801 domain-containing protein [Microbacteriaceae bacterium]|nr:DUF1801 domain-containing protein [Microbacteriaceae bacterium]